MIHLKYKCKVNFVKLPLIWIYRCLKLVFENATPGRNTGCRSVVNCASSFSSLFLMTSAASIVSTWHTIRGGVRELKNAHNSITVQNRTHDYMNFFDHKNPGNLLLQLCPKVVKHPVSPSRYPLHIPTSLYFLMTGLLCKLRIKWQSKYIIVYS